MRYLPHCNTARYVKNESNFETNKQYQLAVLFTGGIDFRTHLYIKFMSENSPVIRFYLRKKWPLCNVSNESVTLHNKYNESFIMYKYDCSWGLKFVD